MGANVWYLNENDGTDSSYTDFTAMNGSRADSSYTDLTVKSSNRPVPVRNRPAAKPAVKTSAKPAVKSAGRKVRVKAKKKSSAGKVLFCMAGIIAVGLAVVLLKDSVVEASSKLMNGEFFSETEATDKTVHKSKKSSEDAFEMTAERTSYDTSSPAYEVAENIMATLWCDNDIDTAWEIFNWVHSNISYLPVTESLSFEDAAYRGFTRKSGDCYVSFACAKMLLDCAGIPNLMVERYPVYENSHFWNLVQLNGEWYHCDATVFKDHPDLYFMCTDEEICDSHHSFDGFLYPERASWYSDYQAPYDYQPDEALSYWDDPYDGDLYYDEDTGYWKDPYAEEYPDYWDESYYGDGEVFWDDQHPEEFDYRPGPYAGVADYWSGPYVEEDAYVTGPYYGN